MKVVLKSVNQYSTNVVCVYKDDEPALVTIAINDRMVTVKHAELVAALTAVKHSPN